MSIEVRPCADVEEYGAGLSAIWQFFGAEPDAEGLERFQRVLPLDRMHAAFEEGAVVGGGGAFVFSMSVPGGSLPCYGVTVVGVQPTHRRRGVLTRLMRAQLDDARERGEPIAALWASEEVIYRRFGYGLASFAGEIELASTHSGLRAPRAEGATTRLITLEEAKTLVPPVYDRVRAVTPGMFGRTQDWWELRNLADPTDRRQGGGVKNALLLELDGEPAGYALYRFHMKFDEGSAAGHVEVVEALADGPVATRELWRVLLDMDWKATLKAYLLPIDHPLQHQLSYPRRMRMRVGDGLWVRLVEIGAALSAREYGDDGSVVLEVEDSFLPENAGRWRIADGTAERTEEEADLALDIGELGSVYLGGFTFAELVRAGVVSELKESGAARADAVFLTAAPKPWCPEIF